MTLSPDGTAYDLTGPVEAPVVVLIHGLGLSRNSTWGVIAPLLAKRFRVLSYDLPGHGQSAPHAGPLTLSTLSLQLLTLMDRLALPRTALVGFSLGGMINRRVALDHPIRVSALAILNSPHERAPDLQARVEAQARDAASGGPAATIDAALERWFTPELHDHAPDLVDSIRQTVLATDPVSYAAHRLVLAEGVTELIRPQPPLTLPSLVMTCENDSGSTPIMAGAIAAEITNSQCLILPALRHLGLIEAPQAFAGRLTQFLSLHA
ncbi:alpha/beta fold hydrolase [uncultured Roseovarius sp.]|uniref:alpha/beta fold hydrolase n=1 Tax=uncultured Roseovarius sp. TaxID=293344 RepID=UPI0026343D18|nr:alpha/beta fold hydrolase [uncultured Roseovarius sp.]